MTKILVTVPELEGSSDAIEEIRSVSPDLEIEQRTCRSNPELTELLGDAEILYTHWFPTQLEPDASLRWLQMTSTGVDNKISNPVFDPSNGVTVTRRRWLPRCPDRRILHLRHGPAGTRLAGLLPRPAAEGPQPRDTAHLPISPD